MFYRRKTKLLVLVIVLLFILSFIFIDYRLKASLLELAHTQAELRTMEIVTQAVYEQTVGGTKYQDIVYIHKDDLGRIVMLQANTVVINQLMARITQAVLQGLKNRDDELIKIPLGQISGIKLLAGQGPRFTVKVIPTQRIYVAVDDKFEQAGINQTRHCIYMQIKTRIKIAVPFMNEELNVVTTVPVVETIIVGDVPQTYVSLNGLSNTINPLAFGKEP